MTSIMLHKEKGINPYMSYCQRCGGEAEELLLIGANDKVYQCTKCSKKYIGKTFSRTCQDKSCNGYLKYIGHLEDGIRLPASEPCNACQQELKEHKEEVAKGGVYWQCNKCGSSGVIKATSGFSAEIRKVHNIFAPEPCGIDFTDEAEKYCPVCSKGKEHE